jgi:hypothetical protein
MSRLRPYAVRSFRRGPLWFGLSLLSGRGFAGLSLGRIGGVRLGVISSAGGRRRDPALPRHDPAEELRRASLALAAAQARYDAAVRAVR